MGVKEELEAFRDRHRGVTHLVYGDIGAGMVLFAAADGALGQEAHDAMVVQAGEVLTGPAPALLPAGGAVRVAVAGGGGLRLFAQAGSPDEALALALAPGARVSEVGADALSVLARLADEG